MKKIFSIFTLAALLLVAVSCDKIDNPHKPYTPTGGNKTVLIKDFTGARCVNCPEAAETVHELQHRLGEDRIFILSVHAGFLAQPMGQFPDFLTEEGDQWYGNHDSNPLFTVDHVALTDGNTLNVDQVDTPVSDALAEPQTFDIFAINDYDETTRLLKVDLDVIATSDYIGDVYVTMCLVEDSIVGWQTTSGGLDREYVFRNVFRGTINGADGTPLFNGQVYIDDEYKREYSIEIDSTYNVDQCYLMTYVYDKTQGDKILQTTVKKIK